MICRAWETSTYESKNVIIQLHPNQKWYKSKMKDKILIRRKGTCVILTELEFSDLFRIVEEGGK